MSIATFFPRGRLSPHGVALIASLWRQCGPGSHPVGSFISIHSLQELRCGVDSCHNDRVHASRHAGLKELMPCSCLTMASSKFVGAGARARVASSILVQQTRSLSRTVTRRLAQPRSTLSKVWAPIGSFESGTQDKCMTTSLPFCGFI